MKSRLLISGLLVAGLAGPAAFMGASDPSPQFTAIEGSDAYTTDTPLSPGDVRRKAVFDDQMDKIGVVKDVFDSTRFGPLAIIEVKVDRDHSSKHVAVALDQLSLEPDGRLVALLDSEDLKMLPKFTRPVAASS